MQIVISSFFFFSYSKNCGDSLPVHWMMVLWNKKQCRSGLPTFLWVLLFFSPSPWICKCKCDLIKDSGCLYHVDAWCRERCWWRVDNSNQTTHTLPSLTCNAALNSSALIEKRATVLTHSIICIILKSWKCHCCFMIIVGKWLAIAFIHSRKKKKVFYYSLFNINKD